jgi:hypothetical protein
MRWSKRIGKRSPRDATAPRPTSVTVDGKITLNSRTLVEIALCQLRNATDPRHFSLQDKPAIPSSAVRDLRAVRGLTTQERSVALAQPRGGSVFTNGFCNIAEECGS